MVWNFLSHILLPARSVRRTRSIYRKPAQSCQTLPLPAETGTGQSQVLGNQLYGNGSSRFRDSLRPALHGTLRHPGCSPSLLPTVQDLRVSGSRAIPKLANATSGSSSWGLNHNPTMMHTFFSPRFSLAVLTSCAAFLLTMGGTPPAAAATPPPEAPLSQDRQAVFQGFQTLLVFFIFQEGLPVLREGSLRRRCCRGCRGSAPHGEQESRAGRKNGKGKTGTEEGVHHRRIMIQAP